MQRRQFLQHLAVAGLGIARPHLVLARAATDPRLVLIILRGGLDGLAAVPA